MYRIREVDGHDDEIADALTELHQLTFFDGLPSGVRRGALVDCISRFQPGCLCRCRAVDARGQCGVSAGSAYCENIAVTLFSCG